MDSISFLFHSIGSLLYSLFIWKDNQSKMNFHLLTLHLQSKRHKDKVSTFLLVLEQLLAQKLKITITTRGHFFSCSIVKNLHTPQCLDNTPPGGIFCWLKRRPLNSSYMITSFWTSCPFINEFFCIAEELH